MKRHAYETDLGWLPMITDMEERRRAHEIWLAAETKEEAWERIFAAFPRAGHAKSFFDNGPPRKYESEGLPDYCEAAEFERHDPLYRVRDGRATIENNPLQEGIDYE